MVHPAHVQYTSPRNLYLMYILADSIISEIDTKKRYISIGSGVGILEQRFLKAGVYIKSADISKPIGIPEVDQSIRVFDFWRNRYTQPLDYSMTNFYEDFEIVECNEKFDTAILYRFGPLQNERLLEDHKDKLDMFISKLLTYSDSILIYDTTIPKILREYLKGIDRVEIRKVPDSIY